MLTNLRLNSSTDYIPREPDKRFGRDIKCDLKTGLDLLFEFKEKLDLLHPEVTVIIENMLQHRSRF